MRILIIKYLNILALLSFLAWFLWPNPESWGFEWEPLIGFILVLVTYLGLEAKDHHQDSVSEIEQKKFKPSEPIADPDDIDLLRTFRGLLAPGDIKFFREHDFLGAFPNEPMKRLFEYLETWTTVEHEFIDPQVQEEHAKFRRKAEVLGQVLSAYTTNNGKFSTVKPSASQAGPTPEWVRKEAEEINQRASEFVEAHQEFLKFARKKYSGTNIL
tara:strand:- start:1641 stop:2282 length:642 start_codon:yes stop_codon:yes gene_type:complete